MILELDVGNSRIKWRVLNPDNTISAQGVAPDLETLAGLPETRGDMKAVRLCSVREGDIVAQVKSWVKTRYQLEVAVAAVVAQCGAVSNQYRDPSRLGVDRWLAMLAGFERVNGACVVVDGGTALTIDILSSQGAHQGGYILPGLQMMHSALVQNTAIRLASEQYIPSIQLGHSTDQAVKQGSLAAAIALIEKVCAQSLLHTPKLSVLLTGGDAETLESALILEKHTGQIAGKVHLECEVVPDLVLDGLRIACDSAGKE